MIQKWELRQKQKFQGFIREVVERNEMDYIFLLERKGKLYDWLQLIPPEFHGYIGYDWSAKLLPSTELEDKHVGIFDDMVRHGSQLKKFCETMENRTNRKVHVYPIALIGPKDSSNLDVDVEFKDEFDKKEEAMQIVASITNYLLSKGLPLDIDHPMIQIKLKLNGWNFDYDEFLKYLATLGDVFFIPPLPAHKHDTITLDQPLFFDAFKDGKDRSIEKEGVIKIRFYINREEGIWYVVPIVYPSALINIKEYAISCDGKKEYQVPFCKILTHYKSLNNRTKIECCYKCITVNLTLTLAQNFLKKLAIFLKKGDYPFPELIVPDKDLRWYYGPKVREAIVNSLMNNIKKLLDAYKENMLLDEGQLNLFSFLHKTGDYEVEDLSKKYIDDIIDIFMEFEKQFSEKDTERRLLSGLSFTEIKGRNPALKDREISKGLDILLDLGILKPLNLVKDGEQIILEDEEIIENKTYQCFRAYRLGEVRDKDARSDGYIRARTARMIPHLLSRIIELNKLKEGVSTLKGYKSIWTFKKMCKDLDLNLEKVYDLYGPVPYCPELPTLPRITLKDLGEDYGTFEIDFSKRPVMLRPRGKWDSDLDIYFIKELGEDILLYSWSDIISRLYPLSILVEESKSLDGKRYSLDAVTTLATCCGEEEVYEAEYHVIINEWKQRLGGFLDYLKRNINLLGNNEIKEETDNLAVRVAKTHNEFGSKLMRYGNLALLKKEIESIDWPYGYTPFINAILDSLEIPPQDTDRLKHLKRTYYIVRAFTNLLRNILSTMDYASPPKDDQKTLDDYLEEFVRQKLIVMDDDTKKEFVDKIRNQRDIEYAFKWIDEVYQKIDQEILLLLIIYKKFLPKEYEKRVFIGLDYDLLAPIGRPIEEYVKKNGFLPVICYDFEEIPRDMIHDYDILILSCCKLAIFDVTSGAGQFFEIERSIDFQEMNVLIVYGIREPGGPPPPDLSSMVDSGVFKKYERFTHKGYSNMQELEKIIANWLNEQRAG